MFMVQVRLYSGSRFLFNMMMLNSNFKLALDWLYNVQGLKISHITLMKLKIASHLLVEFNWLNPQRAVNIEEQPRSAVHKEKSTGTNRRNYYVTYF